MSGTLIGGVPMNPPTAPYWADMFSGGTCIQITANNTGRYLTVAAGKLLGTYQQGAGNVVLTGGLGGATVVKGSSFASLYAVSTNMDGGFGAGIVVCYK